MLKAWLFIKRGFVSMLSYRVSLAIGLLSGFISILQFAFMARFIAAGNSFPALAQYGGNLVAYLIIGTAFTSFVGVSITSFQGAIRSEQQMGTLEHLLLSDTPLYMILLYSALWNFLYVLVNTTILFGLVIFFFGVKLVVNAFGALVILALTVMALAGLGAVGAGIIMVTKQGDPVSWVLTTLTGLAGGVFFPVEFLPLPIQWVSAILPTTHALDALRLVLIQGAPLSAVMPQILFLAGTALVSIPIGVVMFQWGFDQARRMGSLSEY